MLRCSALKQPRFTLFTVFCSSSPTKADVRDTLLSAVGMVTDDDTVPGVDIPLMSVRHSRLSVPSRQPSLGPPVWIRIRLLLVRQALTCTRRSLGRRDAREAAGRPSADRRCPTESR